MSAAALATPRARSSITRSSAETAKVTPDESSHGAAPAAEPWHRRLAITLRAPGPWLAALTFAVYAAQWLAVIGFLPTLYQQSGWGGALGAVLTATVAAVNMVGNIWAGRLLHRGVHARTVLWSGFVAMAVGAWLAFGSATVDAPVLRYGGGTAVARDATPAKAGELAHLRLRYKLPGQDRSRLIETPVQRSSLQHRPGESLRFATAVAVMPYRSSRPGAASSDATPDRCARR